MPKPPPSRRSMNLACAPLLLCLIVMLLRAQPAEPHLRVVDDWAVPHLTSTLQTEEISTLEAGETRLVKLAGGETHYYRVTSAAGQLLRVTVEQMGINVTLTLRALGASEPVVMDAVSKTLGVEELSWESTSGGQYILEVGPKTKDAKSGSYKIALQKFAAADAKDKKRILGERLFMEARREQSASEKTAYQRSAQKFEEAGAEFARAGEPKWEARALNSAGTVNALLGNSNRARELYERALKLWSEARDALGESDTLSNLGGVLSRQGHLDEALTKLTRAQTLAHAGGDRGGEADILNSLAFIYANAGQQEKARATLNLILQIRRELGDRRGEAITLNNIGLTYYFGQQHAEAIKFFEAGRTIGRDLGDKRVMADSLSNIGISLLAMSHYEKAQANFEQALALRRELGDTLGERAALSNLGNVFMNLGQYEAAHKNYEHALKIIRTIGDRKGEGSVRTNLGIIYWHLSDYGRALAEQNQALTISREFKDRHSEANVLNNMGLIYWRQGELERALDLFEQTRVVRRDLGNKLGEASTLANLGNVHMDMGDADAARRFYEQALALMREVGNRNYEGAIILNIGEVYHQQRQFARALENFREVLRITRDVKDRRSEERSLINMGNVFLETGEYEEAGVSYERALAIARDIKDTSGEASVLYGLSRLGLKRGQLAKARLHAAASCDLIEKVRTRIGTEESRASYFATAQRYYEHYIDVLMRMHDEAPQGGFDAEAFQVSERKRARSLLEVLNEGRIKAGRVDPDLARRENSLRELLNAKAQRRVELLNGPRDEETLGTISKEITELLRELEQVRAEIRRSSPQYAALTQPSPLSVKEVQRQLDPDTLLLEYSLGDETSYGWAITRKSKMSFKLPGRATVEAAAKQFFNLITARTKEPFETESIRLARVVKADAAYPDAAEKLGRMLLGLAASQLTGKRLLIVADGAVQFVPFAALAQPDVGVPRRDRNVPTPLIVTHEIITLPSASALAVMRREADRGVRTTDGVAVFADPVFDKEDPRVRAGREAAAANAANSCDAESDAGQRLRRAALGSEVERVDLPRLPCTRREAEAIAVVAPAGSIQVTDFDASRQMMLSSDLRNYRIVHVATHGLLDSANPELSSLVLSLVNERGNPQNGFLRLHDIYNLDLPVEMVVLSSCQSALGKDIKGEGLLGMTRGFMYAGARRLVVSLWEVSDAGTSELMSDFYRRMLKGGSRPPAALRKAQIKMWRDGQWKAPYYWAGFILQGEYR